MQFTCSSCPKKFSSQIEQANHTLACSKKTSCSISLASGTVTAYRNSNNQWPCYCDIPQCDNKAYPTKKALQMHIRRHANANTQWKVYTSQIM